MWTSSVVQSMHELFLVNHRYPIMMLFRFSRFSMKKCCIVFIPSILRCSLTWWWIIPTELLVLSAFQVYIGHWSFSSSHFILLAR